MAIKQAVEAKDFTEVYRARTNLLDAYPQYSSNDALAEAVERASAAEQAAIAWVAKRQAAEKPSAAPPATIIFAQRRFTASPPARNAASFSSAQPARSMDWMQPRAECSGGNSSVSTPMGGRKAARLLLLHPLKAQVRAASQDRSSGVLQADNDIIITAASRREVQRIEAATGRVKWRYAIAGAVCGDPILAGDQVLAATRNGRLAVIDAAKGSSAGYVQFPQDLAASAAFDPLRKLVFLPADHDNLFVLAMPDKRCCQVLPLGHGPGSIAAPPVVLGDYLFVALNDTASDCSLRVMEIRPVEKQSPEPPLQAVQTISLKGHINVRPSTMGDRVLVATDNGNVHLFERSPSGKLPFREAASARLEGPQGTARFPLLQAAACLVGDTHLARFEIQAGDNRLSPLWRDDSAGGVCQSLDTIKGTVFCVRRMQNLRGVAVSAVSASKGMPYWQTTLATPLVGEPAVSADGRTVTAATAIGDVFALPASGIADQAIVDEPAAALPAGADGPVLRRPVTDLVDCGGKLVLSGGSGANQIFVVDSDAHQRSPAAWDLPAALACRPIAFAGGLLAPLSAGQIYLLEPLSGKALCAPFQPRLQPGALPSWREPVAVGDKQVVICDGRSQLYRLQLVEKPVPHLEIAAKIDLAEPIVSSLALGGKTVCGVDTLGKLNFFGLPDMGRGEQMRARRAMRLGTVPHRQSPDACHRHRPVLLLRRLGPAHLAGHDGLWPASGLSASGQGPLLVGRGQRRCVACRCRQRKGTGQSRSRPPPGDRPNPAGWSAPHRRARWLPLPDCTTMNNQGRIPQAGGGCDRRRSAAIPSKRRCLPESTRCAAMRRINSPTVLLAFVFIACLAGRALADEPLFEQDPFDQITLDENNGSAELKVKPLDLPARRLPANPPPDAKLIIRLVDRPDKKYEVVWGAIRKVKLFEQMLLEKANELVAAGDMDGAYDYFRFMQENCWATPGLAEAHEEFLFKQAKAFFTDKQYRNALSVLRELHRRNPRHARVDTAMGAMTEKLIEQYAATADYASIRGLLRSLAACYPHHATVAKWETRLKQEAAVQLADAQRASQSGDLRKAAAAIRRVVLLWPALDGAKELAAAIHKQYPRVVVGVCQAVPDRPSGKRRNRLGIPQRLACSPRGQANLSLALRIDSRRPFGRTICLSFRRRQDRRNPAAFDHKSRSRGGLFAL